MSDTTEPSQCLKCVRRVHGEVLVTHISRVASPVSVGDKTLEYFWTCGRDGNYCVHALEATTSPGGPVHLRTIHRSSPVFGQHVEGAYFDEISHDLMLYGFRSNRFILWNETTQCALIDLECGGVHRSWAYNPYRDAAGAGVFLWKKASDFNIFQMGTASHRALRAGGHGREIKCAAVSSVIDGSEGSLIATGAEDTTVRIFMPTDSKTESPWGIFRCLRVLNKHETGLQQISWSKNGKFLFTSGGCEEFFVWRIRSIPEFGIATLHEASSPKDDPTSDLRITSFDVLDVEGQEGGDCFLLCLVYSNSMVKVSISMVYLSISTDFLGFPLCVIWRRGPLYAARKRYIHDQLPYSSELPAFRFLDQPGNVRDGWSLYALGLKCYCQRLFLCDIISYYPKVNIPAKYDKPNYDILAHSTSHPS